MANPTFDPEDTYTVGRLVRGLTDRMTSTHTYARAQHHTDQVLHPDFGVLARLGEFSRPPQKRPVPPKPTRASNWPAGSRTPPAR